MARSKIEWTDHSWNPITGCTKISTGCKNCYAERLAERFRGIKGHPYEQGFDLKLWPERLEIPLRWKKPRMVFVCSMSDLFQDGIETQFIEDVFAVMRCCPQHTFQVLTKRPQRAYAFFWDYGKPPPNVWLGTSVENQENADNRIPDLLQCQTSVRFLSVEPMLGPIDLNPWLPTVCSMHHRRDCCGRKSEIDWVIVGCESGPKRRPMGLDWARSILAQCRAANVPVFIKQLSINGRVSKYPADWPADLQVRDWPR